MDATYLMTPDSVAAEAPRGGEAAGSLAQPWEMEGFLPAAGLCSTPRDIAVYAQYLLDNGLPDFTWEQDEASGAYWHNGESFGFSSVLIIHPEAHTATFIISDAPKSVVDLGLSLHKETFHSPDPDRHTDPAREASVTDGG